MKINFKSPLVGVGVFLLLCLAWFMYEGKESTYQKPNQEAPQVVVKDSFLSEDKNGKRLWEMNAKTMQVDVVKQANVMTGITGKLFRDNGETVDLTAENGIVYLKTKDINLENVVLISSSGEKLTTDKLEFDNTKNTITATGSVVFTKEDTLAKADKAVTDKEFITVKLIGNAFVKKGGN